VARMSRFPPVLSLLIVLLMLLVVSPTAAQLPSGAAPAGSVAEGQAADVQSLRERAAEYWAARVARDYRAQWALMEPRFTGRTDPDEYAKGKGAVRYLGYEVGDAKIDGFFATVQVKVLGEVAVPGRATSKPYTKVATLSDAWIRVDGVWYRRADQPSEPAPQAPRAEAGR
jgi:hypothetical protein